MPIQVKYLDNGMGVMFIGTGIVTGDDVINSNKEIFFSEEKMKNYKYGLVDYSNISRLDASISDIEIMASQDKEASEFITDAVVAFIAKKDLEFALTRMWEMIAENTGLQWETMVFRDKGKAEIWIKDRIREKHNIEITIA